MKTDLFSLAKDIKLSPTSKAAKLIASGSKDEKALAKALLTTKAYKEDIEITAAVDIVLTENARALFANKPKNRFR